MIAANGRILLRLQDVSVWVTPVVSAEATETGTWYMAQFHELRGVELPDSKGRDVDEALQNLLHVTSLHFAQKGQQVLLDTLYENDAPCLVGDCLMGGEM